MMKYLYNKRISPPAPYINLEVFSVENPSNRTQPVAAKLDTGADISAVPLLLLDQLNIEPAGALEVSGYDDRIVTVPFYVVGLELAEARIRSVKVIALTSDHALLGRDILNHFYIALDGPDLTFEVRAG